MVGEVVDEKRVCGRWCILERSNALRAVGSVLGSIGVLFYLRDVTMSRLIYRWRWKSRGSFWNRCLFGTGAASARHHVSVCQKSWLSSLYGVTRKVSLDAWLFIRC